MRRVARATARGLRWRWQRRGDPLARLIRAGCAAAALLAAPVLALAGDVQVLCEPGLRVLLEGRLAGVSSAREDGLFLVNVSSGTRTLRVEKEGYLPQTFRVEVPEQPIEIRVGEFVPEPARAAAATTAESVREETGGTVVITSAPQNCTVELNGALHSKRSPQLVVSGVPPGEHAISFTKEGYPPIRGIVAVRPGVRTAVRGNLLDGRVESVHEGKGSLRVLTRPDRCTVRFLGRAAETSRGRWNLSHVPAGQHRLEVSRQGLELTVDVLIADGRRTVVSVSFLPGDEPVTMSYEPE